MSKHILRSWMMSSLQFSFHWVVIFTYIVIFSFISSSCSAGVFRQARHAGRVPFHVRFGATSFHLSFICGGCQTHSFEPVNCFSVCKLCLPFSTWGRSVSEPAPHRSSHWLEWNAAKRPQIDRCLSTWQCAPTCCNLVTYFISATMFLCHTFEVVASNFTGEKFLVDCFFFHCFASPSLCHHYNVNLACIAHQKQPCLPAAEQKASLSEPGCCHTFKLFIRILIDRNMII